MSGSIKLPAVVVEWLLRGALAAASKDDVTPVLCAVQWSVENGRVSVLATDRYRVHQLYSKELIGDDELDVPAEGRFLMGRDQAMLLLRSLPKRSAPLPGVVELTWVDAVPLPTGHTGRIPRSAHGSLRFDVASHDGTDAEHLIHDGWQVRGKFPPVGRLFDDAANAEGDLVHDVALTPEYLADTRWLRSGHGSLRFVMPRAKDGVAGMFPVLVMNTEGTARALIQPHVKAAGGPWKEYGA